MTHKPRQSGFTMIEVMISILLTAIAVMGIIGLTSVSVRDSASARHVTEASVLAEDKMELLRATAPSTTGSPDSSPVDAQGSASGSAGAIYTRSWSYTSTTTQYNITVQVSWKDEGTAAATTCATSGARCVTMRSVRGP
jgi:type IV pilus modification protein PilV